MGEASNAVKGVSIELFSTGACQSRVGRRDFHASPPWSGLAQEMRFSCAPRALQQAV